MWPSGALKRSAADATAEFTAIWIPFDPPSLRGVILESEDLFRLVRGYLDPGVFLCKTVKLSRPSQDQYMRALRVSLRQARVCFKQACCFLDHVAGRVFLGTTSQCTEHQSLQGCKQVLEQCGYVHHLEEEGKLHVSGGCTMAGPMNKDRLAGLEVFLPQRAAPRHEAPILGRPAGGGGG